MAKVWLKKEEMLEKMRGPDGYLYLIWPRNKYLNQEIVRLINEGRFMLDQEDQNTGTISWYYVDITTLLTISSFYQQGTDFQLRRIGPDGRSHLWEPRKEDIRRIHNLLQNKEGQQN